LIDLMGSGLCVPSEVGNPFLELVDRFWNGKAELIPRGTPLRYTILEKLQKTIHGGIWKAKDNLTGEVVIAKISRLISRRTSAESPSREKLVLDSLHKELKQNQHVIRLLDSFPLVHRGRKCLCLILEYAEGGDLMGKVLETQAQGLSEREARAYFVMVAKGLQCLHIRNVCHLDLSPENVLLTKQGNAKIADFGQAELGTSLRVSPTDCMRQKVRYRCPEIATKLEEYDGRKADIWSLGVTLWVALTGKFCYEAPRPSDPGYRMISQGTDGIRCWLVRSGVIAPSDCLLDLLTVLLQLEPSRRPTIEEVLTHPWCKGSGESHKN